MGGIFVASMTVPESAIDANRHVNNLAYLHWMQSISIEHALSGGFSLKQLMKAGGSWAICAHSIDYVSPCFENDRIAIFTWIARLGEKSFQRRYLFYRPSDHSILAEASTTFVYVDMNTGKAQPIPEALREKLAVSDENDELLQALREETCPAEIIVQAIASGRTLSDESVHSFSVDKALSPKQQLRQ